VRELKSEVLRRIRLPEVTVLYIYMSRNKDKKSASLVNTAKEK
jgi:hypothetical protein